MLTSLKTYDKPAKFPVARGPLRDDCHAASFRECVLYDSTCVSYFFHALLMSERNGARTRCLPICYICGTNLISRSDFEKKNKIK